VDAFRNRQVEESSVETGDTRAQVRDGAASTVEHVVVQADLRGHLCNGGSLRVPGETETARVSWDHERLIGCRANEPFH
jgi:hypothetical protein